MKMEFFNKNELKQCPILDCSGYLLSIIDHKYYQCSLCDKYFKPEIKYKEISTMEAMKHVNRSKP